MMGSFRVKWLKDNIINNDQVILLYAIPSTFLGNFVYVCDDDIPKLDFAV